MRTIDLREKPYSLAIAHAALPKEGAKVTRYIGLASGKEEIVNAGEPCSFVNTEIGWVRERLTAEAIRMRFT